MKYDRIKNLREDHDLLQKDIAKALNIAQRTYSGYEMGNRNIPIKYLIMLADYYDTSIDYIVGRTDDITPYTKEK